jgi:hypothetical protein
MELREPHTALARQTIVGARSKELDFNQLDNINPAVIGSMVVMVPGFGFVWLTSRPFQPL